MSVDYYDIVRLHVHPLLSIFEGSKYPMIVVCYIYMYVNQPIVI